MRQSTGCRASRLQESKACGPEIDPLSPALAGEFLTTGPRGKPHNFSMIASPLYAMTREAPLVPVVQNPLSKDAFQEP